MSLLAGHIDRLQLGLVHSHVRTEPSHVGQGTLIYVKFLPDPRQLWIYIATSGQLHQDRHNQDRQTKQGWKGVWFWGWLYLCAVCRALVKLVTALTSGEALTRYILELGLSLDNWKWGGDSSQAAFFVCLTSSAHDTPAIPPPAITKFIPIHFLLRKRRPFTRSPRHAYALRGQTTWQHRYGTK